MCLSLQNHIMQTNNLMYIPTGFIDSENRDETILPDDWRSQIAGEDSVPCQLGYSRKSYKK